MEVLFNGSSLNLVPPTVALHGRCGRVFGDATHRPLKAAVGGTYDYLTECVSVFPTRFHTSHVSVMGMSLPWHDWQFWVVTGIFLFAAAWLLRGVLPIPILSRRHKRKRRGEKKATLTIAGKPVQK